jgi:RNA polymerase sigma-70 factor (ECF subfamily)
MFQSPLRIVTPPPEPPQESEALADLVDDLRARRPSAERRLFERFSPLVERILARILGVTPDLDDFAQEAFVRIFDRVHELREPLALRRFVASVTVFVAREAIRTKRRRSWLAFVAPERAPEIEVSGIDPVARESVRAFYDVAGKLPDQERIALCLRYVEGMEVVELAAVCQASPSTIKRRLRSAEKRFSRLAAQRPELVDLLGEGGTWPKRVR